jgi:bacterioferritin
MKGNPQIIAELNKLLKNELTAINQYFLHARMMKHWGFERLGKKVYEESIGEMKHADDLIERILFLDGIPNMQRLAKVAVGETPAEQLRLDLALEYDAQKRFNQAIALSVELGDNATREMLDGMLTSEEEHIDWLEAQLTLIEQVGEKMYLAQQIHEES